MDDRFDGQSLTLRARAPLRIDFAGGWTDVPRYAEREGGAVVNAAISLCVHAEFRLGGNRIRLHAEDLAQHLTLDSSRAIRYDGTLDLHKAALNMLPVTGGIEVLTRSDAPGGSGLGASGALDVALVAGLARCRQETLTALELAELAFELEAVELGILGGRQDQYAAALGGFHAFAYADGVSCQRLAVDRSAADDLARHLVLAYTGHSHFSAATHGRVWEAYERRESETKSALSAIRRLAPLAARAIEDRNWQVLASVMRENWLHQQRLDATIATARTREIEAVALDAGAWGLKATGAGAGGCVAILAPPDRCGAVVAAVEHTGARVLPCGFVLDGVAVWEADDADVPE
jgi:D-glycero-alpha-D-manno-heptose-7-phosphate kinase